MQTDADTEAGRGEGREHDPLIDANVWGHVERLTDDSLAAHLEQRAGMLDERRPGPQLLEEAARRLRQSDPGGEPVAWRARYEGEEEWRFLGWPPSHDQYEEVQPLYAAPTDEAPKEEPKYTRLVEGDVGGDIDWPEAPDPMEEVRGDAPPPVEEGERGEDFTRRMLRQVLEASQKHEPITLGTAHEEALQDAIDRLRPPNARQGEGDEPTNDEARRYVERGEEHWSPDRTALLLDWWAGNVEEKREETGDDGYGVIIQPEMARWIADRLRSTPQGEDGDG